MKLTMSKLAICQPIGTTSILRMNVCAPSKGISNIIKDKCCADCDIVFKNFARCDIKVVVDGCSGKVEKEDVEDSGRDVYVYDITINDDMRLINFVAVKDTVE